MPGIVGLITKMPRERAEPMLRQMVEALRHESFYVTGTWIDESLGVYVGWVARKNSFADGMPICNGEGTSVSFSPARSIRTGYAGSSRGPGTRVRHERPFLPCSSLRGRCYFSCVFERKISRTSGGPRTVELRRFLTIGLECTGFTIMSRQSRFTLPRRPRRSLRFVPNYAQRILRGWVSSSPAAVFWRTALYFEVFFCYRLLRFGAFGTVQSTGKTTTSILASGRVRLHWIRNPTTRSCGMLSLATSAGTLMVRSQLQSPLQVAWTLG